MVDIYHAYRVEGDFGDKRRATLSAALLERGYWTLLGNSPESENRFIAVQLSPEKDVQKDVREIGSKLGLDIRGEGSYEMTAESSARLRHSLRRPASQDSVEMCESYFDFD
ncbi:hypothetical protein COU60_04295 [Candidatus Pacearchaeota archaeon CG10_big_fil_rev_8_21_14_0_10_34_76]|nr:MAG: hypothetical protein COU60_04295 [Candidatus Pacearchaeota archaeon CG10_big_fil_rev_8_21_14_0_10_34_76]